MGTNPQSSNPNSPTQKNPQSPQTLTLEINPNQSIHQFNQNPLIFDQDNHNPDHQSTNPSLSPPISLSSFKRPASKRKKGGFNKMKLLFSEKKTQSLIKTLNPIPFIPPQTLDFDRHEELLKRLGLWEFVHIEFDKKVRTDLVAQLIVNYEPAKRCSYVNECRIHLSRPELGRALNLPLRKEKGGSVGKEPVVVDVEEYDSEVAGFIEDFLTNWLLLHGDKWVMPNELVKWTRHIKDGHPDKVDWAAIVWFMVEKELSQGVKLEDCYYASHLQYLIKSQKRESFDEGEPEVEVREEGASVEFHEVVKLDRDMHLQNLEKKESFDEVEAIEEEGASVSVEFDDAIELDSESVVVKEPNVELTLGQENVEKVEAKDGESMEIEGSKDRDMMGVDESMDGVGKGEWVLDGENSKGVHFGQGCNVSEEMVVGADEGSKDGVAKGEWVLGEMAVGGDEDSKDDMAKGEWVLDREKSKGVPFLQHCSMRGDMAVGVDEDSKDDVAKGEWLLDKEKSGSVHFLQGGNMSEEIAVGVDEDSKDDMAKGEWVLDGENSKRVHFLQPCNMREEMNVGSNEEMKDDVAQGDWVLNGRSSMGVHFDNMDMDGDEECKLVEEGERTFIGGEEDEMKIDEEDLDEDDEEEEEEDGEEFCLTPKHNSSRNDLDANQIFYNVNEQFDDQSNMGIISPSVDMGGPSFFGNGKKREISHDDHDLLHDPFDGHNKRPRIDGSSSKSSEFDICMDQIQLWVGKARGMYEARERDVEKLMENQQILINEVQQRADVIDHLQKTPFEDLRKKDDEIYRLDRELFVMGNLIKSYRDALKATQKDFSEYRERCQLPEEPIYKDVGPGGLVLSKMEIERNRLKREEEDKVNRAIFEHNIKQFEEGWVVAFEGYLNQVQIMDLKLLDLEKEASQIKEVSAERKGLKVVDSATPVE